MSLVIQTRSSWGARKVSGLVTQASPQEAFLHHTDDANGFSYPTLSAQQNHMRELQNFHMNVRGWSDLAYHYVVFQPQVTGGSARVFAGRESRFVPAAQLGHNTRTLAIVVVGDGTTEALKPNTRYRIEQILAKYPSITKLGGHRDVVSTTCPGAAMYQAIPRIAAAAGLRHF